MRFILTIILPAQPASAEDGKVHDGQLCRLAKIGFKNNMPANYDGLSAAICWGFVSAGKLRGN